MGPAAPGCAPRALKGIVNTREHLESLFSADELGVGSIQEFLDRERTAVRVAGAGAAS